MNKIVVTLAGALATVACGAASAADLTTDFAGVVTYETVDTLPWYASAKVGVALPGSVNITATGGGFDDLSGSASFDAGFAGSVALGKYITPNVRAELELGVSRNSGSSFDGNVAGIGPSNGPLTGEVTTTTLMAIGYYEFVELGDFVPYVSAGLGGANVHSDLTYDETTATGADGTITGSSAVLAARIGAGFRFAVTDSIDLTADYAALFGGNATFTWTSPGGATRDVSSSVMGHALTVGIKGRF